MKVILETRRAHDVAQGVALPNVTLKERYKRIV